MSDTNILHHANELGINHHLITRAIRIKLLVDDPHPYRLVVPKGRFEWHLFLFVHLGLLILSEEFERRVYIGKRAAFQELGVRKTYRHWH